MPAGESRYNFFRRPDVMTTEAPTCRLACELFDGTTTATQNFRHIDRR